MLTIEHNLCGWGVSVGGHTTGRRVAWAEWVNLVLGSENCCQEAFGIYGQENGGVWPLVV